MEADTSVGFEGICGGVVGAVLEGARSGGASGDDAALFAEGGIDSFGSGGRQRVVFGVETDVFDVFSADRLEGAEADVEGDGFDLNAAGAELFEDFGSKVEAGGGSGGGAELVGEDGLVALAIVSGIVAVDVWGQRHVADAIENSAKVFGGREAESAFAVFGGSDDFGFQERRSVVGGGEVETLAGLNLAAGADEGGPGEGILRLRADEQHFDVAGVAGAMAMKAGGDHAGIVEDQAVAGVQVIGQVTKEAVFPASFGAMHHEHAGTSAVGGWGLGDLFRRKVEIEVSQSMRQWVQAATIARNPPCAYLELKARVTRLPRPLWKTLRVSCRVPLRRR